MTSERGQATIEWLGLVVLLALGLGAAARLVPGAGDRRDPGLGPLLARSIACAPAGCAQRAGRRAAPAPAVRPASASGPATAGALRRRRALRPRAPRPRPLRPRALPRAGAELERAVAAFRRLRGLRVVARRAWIVCLGLKRYRYERAHPEAALPVAGLPVDEAVRIANSCLNPMGFVDDLRRPAVDGGPSP